MEGHKGERDREMTGKTEEKGQKEVTAAETKRERKEQTRAVSRSCGVGSVRLGPAALTDCVICASVLEQRTLRLHLWFGSR